MASLRAFTGKPLQGFTLIEMLVVIGILGLVGTVGLVMSFDSYRQYSYQNDRNLIIATLQKARSQAVNEVCINALIPTCTGGLPHGVHIGSGQVVIFQGTTYNPLDTTNEIVSFSSAATVVGGAGEPTDVVFSELSGDATPNPVGDWNLTVKSTASGESSVITFNTAGQIKWTK